nr:MAG TPA: hypothetical protein [Microviridae sp.]
MRGKYISCLLYGASYIQVQKGVFICDFLN